MRALLMAICIIAGLAAVAPAGAQDGADLSADLAAMLEDFRARYGFPGATAAITLPAYVIGDMVALLGDQLEIVRPLVRIDLALSHRRPFRPGRSTEPECARGPPGAMATRFCWGAAFRECARGAAKSGDPSPPRRPATGAGTRVGRAAAASVDRIPLRTVPGPGHTEVIDLRRVVETHTWVWVQHAVAAAFLQGREHRHVGDVFMCGKRKFAIPDMANGDRERGFVSDNVPVQLRSGRHPEPGPVSEEVIEVRNDWN